MPASTIAPTAPGTSVVQPGWLRATHWLNALSVVLMIASGWRIYDAAPLFGLHFPKALTLGGWLGGALQWHFAAMWLLVANGILYLTLNLATGRFARRFFPLRAAAIRHDLAAALRGRLSHADLSHYNALQRAAYLCAIADLGLLVVSGLVLWKSVQFPLLREAMGGYDGARLVHFFTMAVLVCFSAIHIVMVALVPQTLRTMISTRLGGRR